MPDSPREERLRAEFNRWAEAGRGEEMEDHHRPIVEPILALMDLQPSDRVLDVGCGNGWLCRLIAPLVPQGRAAGIDVADEMVRQAQRASARFPHVSFRAGSADKIPWDAHSFTKVISVESAYYWPEPATGIGEIFRVLRTGGSAWMLINYYRENPYSHQWGSLLSVPTHLLGAEEWKALFRHAGFIGVADQRMPDPTPVPEDCKDPWFVSAEQMRKFKQVGALLVHGTKAPGR